MDSRVSANARIIMRGVVACSAILNLRLMAFATGPSAAIAFRGLVLLCGHISITTRMCASHTTVKCKLTPVILQFFIYAAMCFVTARCPITYVVSQGVTFKIRVVSSHGSSASVLRVICFVILGNRISRVTYRYGNFAYTTVGFRSFALLCRRITG